MSDTAFTRPPPALLVEPVVRAALEEDLGRAGDITSALTIADGTQATARLVARKPGHICGLNCAEAAFRLVDPSLGFTPAIADGDAVTAGALLATIAGPARSLLTGERVALNLLQRACGVATLTRRYVDAVAGTKAVILDTRKTLPGLRLLDKYAVTCGGGTNHRMGLYDAVMVKDNHVAMMRDEGLGMREGIAKLRATLSSLVSHSSSIPIIVECDTLAQLREALDAAPDRILLDNMTPDQLCEAVALAGGRVKLEASGGVSLDTVAAIARTGVDFISVGKLTHSATAVDIGADIILEK